MMQTLSKRTTEYLVEFIEKNNDLCCGLKYSDGTASVNLARYVHAG